MARSHWACSATCNATATTSSWRRSSRMPTATGICRRSLAPAILGRSNSASWKRDRPSCSGGRRVGGRRMKLASPDPGQIYTLFLSSADDEWTRKLRLRVKRLVEDVINPRLGEYREAQVRLALDMWE